MSSARRLAAVAAAVAVKDLRSEARGRTILSVWLTLGSLLLAVVFVTLSASDVAPERVAPSALWLVFALIGTLAVGRGNGGEYELGGWRGLTMTPAPRPAIFAGKLAANLVVTLVAELAVVIGYSLVVAWPRDTLGLLLTLVLGTIGLVAVGTLAAAVLADRRSGDLLLPVMVLPVVVPVIGLAAQLTQASLDRDLSADWWTVVTLLAGYDLVVVLGAAAAFTFIVDAE